MFTVCISPQKRNGFASDPSVLFPIYFFLTSYCFPRTEKNINLFRKFTYLIYILIVYFIISDGAAVRIFSALPHSQQEHQFFNTNNFL